MRVVLVEPGKEAREAEIGEDLVSMQRVVGGYIETCCPFKDPDVLIVCNEEGKINGMSPNRALYAEDGRVADIMFGPFFVCGSKGEDFASLNDDQLEQYRELFRFPERFRIGRDRIEVSAYVPGGIEDRSR